MTRTFGFFSINPIIDWLFELSKNSLYASSISTTVFLEASSQNLFNSSAFTIVAVGFAGLQISFLLGGAVVVESVFAYPGVGRLAMQVVADRDLPVIQAFVVVLAAMILIVNLLVEVIAAWIDPRLRDGSRSWTGAV